jgi:hypothetical protein
MKTTKLGGTASSVVVAKTAVFPSFSPLFLQENANLATEAWTDVDDVRGLVRRFRYTLKLPHRWKTKPISDEQAFETIKAGLDALPDGAKMILNGGRLLSRLRKSVPQIYTGEFYGPGWSIYNVELISRFFEKYQSKYALAYNLRYVRP